MDFKLVAAIVLAMVAMIVLPGYLFQTAMLNLDDEMSGTRDEGSWRWGGVGSGGIELTEYQKKRQRRNLERSRKASQGSPGDSWFNGTPATKTESKTPAVKPGKLQSNPFQ